MHARILQPQISGYGETKTANIRIPISPGKVQMNLGINLDEKDSISTKLKSIQKYIHPSSTVFGCCEAS